MNGPQHYAEAERLLGDVAEPDDPLTVAKSQVHATLALAAAVGLLDTFGGGEFGRPDFDASAWRAATGASE